MKIAIGRTLIGACAVALVLPVLTSPTLAAASEAKVFLKSTIALNTQEGTVTLPL